MGRNIFNKSRHTPEKREKSVKNETKGSTGRYVTYSRSEYMAKPDFGADNTF